MLVATAGLLLIACENSRPPRAPDTSRASAVDSMMDTSANTGAASWRSEVGPFLVIPDDSLTRAMIVTGAEDSLTVDSLGITDSVTVDVFTPAGRVGAALLVPARPSKSDEDCLAWPSARVSRAGRARLPAYWSVGLLAGRVVPSPMDSLAGWSKSDSARLVSEIARLASTAPNDTSPIFRGLPFRVQTAYRMRVSDSESVLIATVVRNINQEADARAEHLLLVASQSRTQRGSPYSLRYFERSSGPEETLETAEVLAAVLVGPERTPTVVIGRSDDAGMAFSLLERNARGGWILRWSSPFNDC